MCRKTNFSISGQPIRYGILVGLLLIFFSPAFAAVTYAQDNLDHQGIVAHEMDCVAKYLKDSSSLPWTDVCVTVDNSSSTSSRRNQIVTQSLNRFSKQRDTESQVSQGNESFPSPAQWESIGRDHFDEEYLYAEAQDNNESSMREIKETGPFDRENPLTKFEMGTEVSHIKYQEPGFMKETGYMYGILMAYTFRTNENKKIRSFGDIFKEENKINMFRFDVKFSWGYVDYEGSGTQDNVRDYMVEPRIVAGYDFPFSETFMLTPYVGFGYRYLNDDLRGDSSTGAHGYRRESNYYYVPIGLDINKTFRNNWSFSANFEYDYFTHGVQKSHLEDADIHYQMIENDQDKGKGLRGSFRIMKKSKDFDFFFEPFIRYWSIKDSDTAPLVYNNVVIGSGMEPENTSTEYGLKIGSRF